MYKHEHVDEAAPVTAAGMSRLAFLAQVGSTLPLVGLIDVHPVTNAEYDALVRASGAPVPSTRTHPLFGAPDRMLDVDRGHARCSPAPSF